MLYDPQHNLIFLKTTKTAGCSLEAALAPSLSRKSIVTPIGSVSMNDGKRAIHDRTYGRTQWAALPSILHGILKFRKMPDGSSLLVHFWRDLKEGRGPRRLAFTPYFTRYTPHMRADEVCAVLGPEVFARALTFAVIRHPYEHAVSMYFYVMATDANFRGWTFRDWLLANTHLMIWNRTIISLNGTCAVKHLLRYEDMPGALVPVLREANIPHEPVMERFSVNRINAQWRPTKGAMAAEVIDSYSKELIDATCCWEFELGRYEKSFKSILR